MAKKFLIIANPISGMGRGRKNAPLLEAELRALGHEAEVYYTNAAGDARTKAESVRHGEYDAIISVGGDGTLSEIVNGIGDKQIPVTVLPTGTANVLAKEYKIPYNTARVAQMAARGKTVMLDVGVLSNAQLGERRFILFAGCGFDATVAEALFKTRKGAITMLSYARPILRVLFGYKFTPINVVIDGRAESATNLLVSNVREYGGPLKLTKDAVPTDGKFDVCLMKARGKWDLIVFGVRSLLGRLHKSKRVKYELGSEIEINVDGVALQADGDFVGYSPAKIKLLPARLPVIVP